MKWPIKPKSASPVEIKLKKNERARSNGGTQFPKCVDMPEQSKLVKTDIPKESQNQTSDGTFYPENDTLIVVAYEQRIKPTLHGKVDITKALESPYDLKGVESIKYYAWRFISQIANHLEHSKRSLSPQILFLFIQKQLSKKR